MANLQRVGFISDAIGCSIALADMRIAQGRLREAMRTYERGLQLATQGASFLRGAADMHVGISQLYYERDDLIAATQHLLRSKELGDLAGLPQNPYRWCVAMAHIRMAEGDLNGALDLLHEAEHLYTGDFSPNVRPVPALKTRVWVAQGRLGEALGWAREQGLSIEDDLSYLREYEHITLARILLAQYQQDHAVDTILDATGLLERLLKAAEDGGRTGSVIEILILLALVHQMQGDIPAALTALERALMLAEPEGYVRIFVDEGHPISLLLEQAAKHGIAPNYVHHLLRAFGKDEDRARVDEGLIELLSARELEVLRLLGTDLDGPDIARQLVVSLNTLRTHTKNIYTKLGVNNRREAMRRADELGLL
jgi:LuxR family maltose regulon positive regulatory protein